MLGSRFVRRLNADWQASVEGYWAHEQAASGSFDYLGFDALGVRLGVQGKWLPKTDVFGVLSYENRRNEGVDPAFMIRREDHQYGLTLGARYLMAPNWTLSPVLTLINQQSNTDAYDYHREIMSLVVRRDF